jgi:8-oxo-dGTP pyrophosphatase MutT (NUDIX family)
MRIMHFSQFISFLTIQLSKPLPGKEAQLKMASIRRINSIHSQNANENARKSGVLVLFFPEDDMIKTVLIKRPEYDGVHSGQIAFPGGRWEDGDENIIETASREAREEIGIDTLHVTILGQLTELFIPPSNSLVFPVIGYCDHKPAMKPQASEVDKIICFPVFDLIKPGIRTTKTVAVGSWSSEVPCYYIDGEIIWGATAMIMSELLELINPINV